MNSAIYLAFIQNETELFASEVKKGIDIPVPSCPKWTVEQLTAHLGEVHRWVADILREKRTSPPPRLPRIKEIPTSPTDLATWLQEGAETLMELLGTDEPTPLVWGWGGQGHNWWRRRQAHETAMHRWDAQNAHGLPNPITTDLAADGIDELFANIPSFPAIKQYEGKGDKLHFRASDTPREWIVTLKHHHLDIKSEAATAEKKPNVTAQGTASDILLFLTGRNLHTALETSGEATLLEQWQEDFSF